MNCLLITNGDPARRLGIAAILGESAAFEVSYASVAEDFAVPFVDAIIVDACLEFDMTDVLARIRKMDASHPILLIIPDGAPDTAFEGLTLGANGFIFESRLTNDLTAHVTSLCTTESERKGLSFSIPNDRQLIREAIEYLCDNFERTGLCDEHEHGRGRLKVAFEEAMINAMIHGNLEVPSDLRETDDHAFTRLVSQRLEEPPYADRHIHVGLFLTPGGGRVSIRDEGPGFDVDAVPDPLAPENLTKSSGRGLLLIRTYVDELSHNAAGNEITLVKLRSPRNTIASRPSCGKGLSRV